MKKVALGKGLEALIGRVDETSAEDKMQLKMVPLNLISGNEYQPRKKFDQQALDELKQSVKERGIIQPLLVRKVGEKYRLIAGERRLRVAKELGISSIPVIIREIGKDGEVLELALIENIQREDLNPIERAESYKRLIIEFGLTQEEVADKVGKERSSVANTLRLLELEDKIKELVIRGELSFGQAKALLSIEDKKERLHYALLSVRQSLTVRQLESLATKNKSKKRSKSPMIADIYLKEAESKLRDALKTKVRIKSCKGEGGRIEIQYYSKSERDRIINIMLNIV